MQVDISNPNEDAILKTIKEHAVQSLGADVSESRTEVALAQALAQLIDLLRRSVLSRCKLIFARLLMLRHVRQWLYRRHLVSHFHVQKQLPCDELR